MKICYLANASSIHTRRLASFFVKRHEVHVISFEAGEIPGATVHRIKMPIMIRNRTFLLKLLYVGRIRNLVKEIDPDVIHAIYATNYGYFAARSDFHPFVLTALGSDVLPLDVEMGLVRWIKKRLAKDALKMADVLSTNGINTAERMQQLVGKAQEVKIFQFGIEVNKFKRNERGSTVKKKLDISGPVVISSRNLYPIYDVETLIKAVPAVLKEFQEASFLIVGMGSEEEKLKAAARSLGVVSNVKFMGYVSNDELPDYLSAADVYVSTSLSDSSISVSTAEAMACELPVIVTDVADNRKWVDDGENGFLVPTRDPKSLTEKIVFLLKNEETRYRFGKKNRQIIEDRDNYAKEMVKLEQIYEEALKKNNATKQ